MQSEWEKQFDLKLIIEIDAVMNTLYESAKMNGKLNEDYLKKCTEIIKKRTCNYIDGKLHALKNI